MRFISWNVNGLRAVLKKGFEDIFLALDADFFCLQETKLQEGQVSLDLPGYESFWCYADKKGYSGTAVFTKHTPISVTRNLGIDEHDHEGRMLTLEYEDFYLVCVYTPNAQDGLRRIEYRLSWEDAFRSRLCELDKVKPVIVCGDMKESPSSSILQPQKRKPIIVCGDLNVAYMPIDLANPDRNHFNPGFSDAEREKFGQLLNSGFVDSFRYLHPDERKYTWWSYRMNARQRNVGWRIDYFLVSDFAADKIKVADIHNEILGSDHCPIRLEIDL